MSFQRYAELHEMVRLSGRGSTTEFPLILLSSDTTIAIVEQGVEKRALRF